MRTANRMREFILFLPSGWELELVGELNDGTSMCLSWCPFCSFFWFETQKTDTEASCCWVEFYGTCESTRPWQALCGRAWRSRDHLDGKKRVDRLQRSRSMPSHGTTCEACLNDPMKVEIKQLSYVLRIRSCPRAIRKIGRKSQATGQRQRRQDQHAWVYHVFLNY